MRDAPIAVVERPAHHQKGLIMFTPSEDMRQWLYDTFIEPDAPLYNEDHGHLLQASIGFLWTEVEARKKGRMILGRAENPVGGSDPWTKARAVQQMEGWFGDVPDFLITIYAPWWNDASHLERCALIEHELYHCAQDQDEYGAPKFNNQTGKPKWTIARHDVEEFVGIVRRYGTVFEDVQQLVAAANNPPMFDGQAVSRVCGCC